MSSSFSGKQPSHRFLCTHNPLYLVSVGLVLYGFHLSFEGQSGANASWLLMKLFCGYTLLLAVAGISIIRYGKVWEDGRMVLLLIAFLLVALSVCFDRVCLDNTQTGLRLLFVGFVFSVALTETIIHALRLRFRWWYRVPLYLQWALLFAYPVWLGHLSLTGQNTRMAWAVLSFPSVGAISILALIPASIRGATRDGISGTPWNWPWYPWPLFVFQIVGLAFRSFGLSMSFELSRGFGAAFQPFYLVPLLLATILIFCELTKAAGRESATKVLALMPILLIPLCLIGNAGNAAQFESLRLLVSRFGSPAWLSLFLMAGFYAYGWARRIGSWEIGMYVVLMWGSVVGPATTDLFSTTEVQWIPWSIIGVLMAVQAFRTGSSMRATISVGLLLFAARLLLQQRGMYIDTAIPIYLTYVYLLMCGLFWNDGMARIVRQVSPTMIVLTSGVFLVGVIVHGRETVIIAASNALAMLVISFAYWWQSKSLRDLNLCFSTFLISVFTYSAAGYYWLENNLALKGRAWIVWGLLSLAAAMLVSFTKAGLLVRLNLALRRLNRRVQKLVES